MLQEIQVRGGVKKGPHPSGGVWIFSGITHYINILFCTINATINMLTKWFHHDEKILMLSSSVICLSFTVLNKKIRYQEKL